MRRWVAMGALLGALGVLLGAFGAHVLEKRLPADLLAIFGTAARYHQVHALALVLVGLVADRWPERRLVDRAGGLLLAGIVLFSGSLYALSLTGVRMLGAITPFGGVALVAGWICLALAAREP